MEDTENVVVVDVHKADDEGLTPLINAIVWRPADTTAAVDQIAEFLDLGADPNYVVRGTYETVVWHLLYYRMRRGTTRYSDYHILKLLIKAGLDLTRPNTTHGTHWVIHSLANSCYRYVGDSLIRMVIDYGVDIDLPTSYGNSALQTTVGVGNEICVKLLLDAGCAVVALSDVNPWEDYYSNLCKMLIEAEY